MKSAVYDLMKAAPHECKNVKLTPPEFRVYREGYYTALRFALEVIDAAGERYTLATKAIRAAARRKRSA